MPTTTKLLRYTNLIGVAALLAFVAFWVTPRIMETPVRNAVQTVAKVYTGNRYLFGFNPTETVNAIIGRVVNYGRVVNDRGGRITREDVPNILTEVIMDYRPDFSRPTVGFVTEAAFNLAVGMLPPVIADPQVLTPILSEVVPTALDSLQATKLPPKYPPLAERLFASNLWLWIASIAALTGIIALLYGETRKIISPQDEVARTRIVQTLVIAPCLPMAAYLTYFLINYRPAIPDVGIFSSPVYIGVTAWIVSVFILFSVIVYFGVVLGIYLLPYFADRVNVLAVWRRLVFPPLLNAPGEILHYIKTDKILEHFTRMLLKQFAREIAP